jgi:hypothetical protein
MTFAELKTDVARRLAEANGRVVWSDIEIATAINEGYAELSDATEWNERTIGIDLLASRPYYDLRTAVPEPLLGVGPAFDESTNRWLLPTAVRELDAHDRRWERVTGAPQRLILRGLWWAGLYPRVTSDAGVLRQYYTALPAPLSDDTDEPGFPEVFHDGPVYYALCDLWSLDGETARALAAWQSYLAIEAALAAYVDERVARPIVHGHGGGR